MPENTSGGAALNSSPSLESVVGEMYGDYRSAEPDPSETGAPPAEGSETADGSEGTTADAPAGELTPATEPDASTVSDPSTPTTSSDPDPFEGSTPLPYTVNGQERTFEGVTVLKDGGAIVDPDALPKLAQRLAERDHLYEQSAAKHRDFQALEKATEWQTTGPNGETRMLRGSEAESEKRVVMAQLAAEVQAYRTLMANPENIRDLVVGNEDGSLAWNQLGVKAFLAELKNAQNELSQNARRSYSAQTQPAPAAPFNPQTLAPVAVSKAIELVGANGLTDADKQWAESLAPRFVRLTTTEDVQANPALVAGQPMIEQQFIDLVKERSDMRASTAKTVSSASDVAKANAARIAAAKTGARPNQPVARITPQKEVERSRDDDFADAFERQERAAAGALRAHAAGAR